MKKLIAMFGILALAACGGGDAEEAAVEDTSAGTPVTETAPVTTTPPMTDTTMAPTTTMDSAAAGATGTTTTAVDTPATTTP